MFFSLTSNLSCPQECYAKIKAKDAKIKELEAEIKKFKSGKLEGKYKFSEKYYSRCCDIKCRFITTLVVLFLVKLAEKRQFNWLFKI